MLIRAQCCMKQALCVSLCLASSVVMSSNEENERDFIDQVLRIRNPDKALNSVLGHMERTRQHSISARHLRARLSDNTDCEEPSEILPEYTESIETSRERGLRQLSTQKHYPICRLERRIRKLNTIEYEFRPAYYEEVLCSASTGDNERVPSEICSSLGFSCVQWNKTIHLTRRRYSSDCWETRTMVIPAGCECMWPVHRLGDISLHV